MIRRFGLARVSVLGMCMVISELLHGVRESHRKFLMLWRSCQEALGYGFKHIYK